MLSQVLQRFSGLGIPVRLQQVLVSVPQSTGFTMLAFCSKICFCPVRITPALTAPTKRKIPRMVAITLPPPNFFLGKDAIIVGTGGSGVNGDEDATDWLGAELII